MQKNYETYLFLEQTRQIPEKTLREIRVKNGLWYTYLIHGILFWGTVANFKIKKSILTWELAD